MIESVLGKSVAANLSTGGTVDGDLTVTGSLGVGGDVSINLTSVVSNSTIIDATGTEAFLVRKESDAGDVFTVDTTNSKAIFGGNLELSASSPQINFSGTAGDYGTFGYTEGDPDVFKWGFFQNSGQIASITMDAVSESSPSARFRFNVGGDTDSAIAIDSSKRIGIGTDSPNVQNHIFGGSASQENILLKVQSNAVTNDGSLSTSILLANSTGLDSTHGAKIQAIRTGSGTDDLVFHTFNSSLIEAMRIDSSQNVSIGTATDSAKYLKFVRGGSGTGSVRGSIGTNNSKLTFIGGSGTTPHMTLDSSGNLGIGITSPTDYHSLADNLVVGSSGDTGISIVSGTTSDGRIFFADGTSGSDESRGHIRYNHDDDSMHFVTNDAGSTSALAIDSSQSVTISSSVNGNPVTSGTTQTNLALRVKGSATNVLDIGQQSASPYGVWMQVCDSTSLGTEYPLLLNPNGGNIGIGITPTETLSIFGGVGSPATSGTGTNGNLAIESSNGNSLYIGSYSASPYGVWLQTSNYTDQSLTYPLILNPRGGNIGISQDSPSYALDITGPATENGSTLRLNDAISSKNSKHLLIQRSSSTASIGIAGSQANDPLWISRSGGYDLIVSSDGNVSIGTGSPIAGGGSKTVLTISDSTQSLLVFEDTGFESSGDGLGMFAFNDGTLTYRTASRSGTDFAGSTNRFVIDANSKISLSNNDGGSHNTIFGYQSANAIASGGDYNVVFGDNALYTEDTGDKSTAIGYASLYSQNVGSGTSANTGVGLETLKFNVTGTNNTAIGHEALLGASGNSHSNNTGVGSTALKSITTGQYNVSIGSRSGEALTTGQKNTMVGAFSGYLSLLPDNCTLVGYNAGGSGVMTADADGTVAVGMNALGNLTSGKKNLAVGHGALNETTIGDSNIAIGYNAMFGDNAMQNDLNIAIGSENAAGSVLAAMGGQWTSNRCEQNIAIGTGSLAGNMNDSHNNVAVGYKSLNAVTTGDNNIGIGTEAGKAINTGNSNVAIGKDAMASATANSENVAIGFEALGDIAVGEAANVAIGYYAMRNVDEGTGGGDANYNVAIGYDALKGGDFAGNDRQLQGNIAIGMEAMNSTGANAQTGTVAIGHQALKDLTSGARNTAVGYQAMDDLTVGEDNVALGYGALGGASTSSENKRSVAIGSSAMSGTNAGASQNIAIGYASLDANLSATADNNTAIGYDALGALDDGSSNVAVGNFAGDNIEDGIENTLIGYGARTSSASAQNQIVIGRAATGQGDNVAVIGNTSVTDVLMAQDGEATIHCSGVKFPPTQQADANVNTLDDYEEGTWTVGLMGNSGVALTTASQSGKYTKIGNMVFVSGTITVSSLNSAIGNLHITGLPFTSSSGTSQQGGAVLKASGLAITDDTNITIEIEQNSTIAYLQNWDVTTGTSLLQTSEFSADGSMSFTMTYTV